MCAIDPDRQASEGGCVNADDDSSLTYLCPQCKARLSARPEEAGSRRECSHCGKVVKVPGTPHKHVDRANGKQPSETERHTGKVAGHGIANIAIICPVCGTRMYATPAQTGGTMVCPDCLETVIVDVPERKPKTDAEKPETRKESANRDPRKPRAQADEPDTNSDGTTPTTAANSDDDELKLGEPIVIPRAVIMPKELLDLIEQEEQSVDAAVAATSADRPATHPPTDADKTPVASGVEPPVEPPHEFSFKCPVCDTMIYVGQEVWGRPGPAPTAIPRLSSRPP